MVAHMFANDLLAPPWSIMNIRVRHVDDGGSNQQEARKTFESWPPWPSGETVSKDQRPSLAKPHYLPLNRWFKRLPGPFWQV